MPVMPKTVRALEDLDDQAGGQLQSAPGRFTEPVFDPVFRRQSILFRDSLKRGRKLCNRPVDDWPTIVVDLLETGFVIHVGSLSSG